MKGSLFKRGEIWYFRRSVNGTRRSVSLRVTRKADALEERAKVVQADRAVTIPGYTHKHAPKMPTDEAFPIFVNSPRRRQCAESTLMGYAHYWGRFVGRLKDCSDLRFLTREAVSEYLVALRDVVGPNTYNKHLNGLRYVWRVVQGEKGIALPDVFSGIPALPVPIVSYEPFTTDQIRTLWRHASAGPIWDELQDIILTAAHTGLRRIDCLMLEKRSYQPEHRLLVLTPRKTRRTGAKAVLGLSEALLEVVERRTASVEGNYLFPEAAALMQHCPVTWGMRFKKFLVSTLNLNGSGKGYGFHSFRHWFRSSLTDSDISEAVINAIMCHAQSSIQARYVHVSADRLIAAAATLPDVRRAGANSPK